MVGLSRLQAAIENRLSSEGNFTGADRYKMTLLTLISLLLITDKVDDSVGVKESGF